MNCLHLAVSSDNRIPIRYILENCQDTVNVKARIDNAESSLNGYNALDLAARYDMPDLIDILVQDAKLDPNDTNLKGDTPFMIATTYGFLDCCQQLKDNGTVMVFRNPKTDFTYLHVACMKGYFEIMQLILGDPLVEVVIEDYVNQTTKKETTAVHLACIPCKPPYVLEKLVDLELIDGEVATRLDEHWQG
jgi:ankyrin repeat protein